jgi:hypothetical protein
MGFHTGSCGDLKSLAAPSEASKLNILRHWGLPGRAETPSISHIHPVLPGAD